MQNENAQVASGRPSIADRFGLAEVFDQGLRLAHFRLKRLQRNVRRRALPLRSLQPAVADAIIAGILEVLGDGGRLVQFTYDLRRTSVPERPGLDQLYTHRVWANLPPARVDVFDYQAGGEALVTTNTAC